MPDRGLMELGAVTPGEFTAQSPLVMENARWLQVTFEVERDAALAFLPPDVGRPIPPYARLLVAESAWGSLAVLSVGGRYRMLPRNVVVDVIAEGALAGAASAAFSASTAGAMHLTREGARVTATVTSADGPLAAVTLPAIYAIEPGMLRWDPLVALGRQDASAAIAEITPELDVRAAFLSKGASCEADAELRLSHPWRRLRSLATISACYLEGTLTFGAPQVQQTWS